MSAQSGPPPRGTWSWVAHAPGAPPVPPKTSPPVPRSRLGPAWRDETPGYPVTPRWGLPRHHLPAGQGATRDGRAGGAARTGLVGRGVAGVTGFLGRLGELAPAMLQATAVVTGIAAGAHLLRYLALGFWSQRIAPGWVEVLTWAAVLFTGLFAALLAAVTIVSSAAWLVERRAHAYGPAGDPRTRLSQWALCLIWPLNLLYAAVLLRELDLAVTWRRRTSGARAGSAEYLELPPPTEPGTRTWIMRWWALWALSGVAWVVTWWRSTADGLQAAADSVLLAAVAYASAAATAVVTRRVMKCFDNTSPPLTSPLTGARIVGVDNAAAREEREHAG